MLHKLRTKAAKMSQIRYSHFCTFLTRVTKAVSMKNFHNVQPSSEPVANKHTGLMKGNMQNRHTATTTLSLQEIVRTRVAHVTGQHAKVFMHCDAVFAAGECVHVRAESSRHVQRKGTQSLARDVRQTCTCFIHPLLPCYEAARLEM